MTASSTLASTCTRHVQSPEAVGGAVQHQRSGSAERSSLTAAVAAAAPTCFCTFHLATRMKVVGWHQGIGSIPNSTASRHLQAAQQCSAVSSATWSPACPHNPPDRLDPQPSPRAPTQPRTYNSCRAAPPPRKNNPHPPAPRVPPHLWRSVMRCPCRTVSWWMMLPCSGCCRSPPSARLCASAGLVASMPPRPKPAPRWLCAGPCCAGRSPHTSWHPDCQCRLKGWQKQAPRLACACIADASSRHLPACTCMADASLRMAKPMECRRWACAVVRPCSRPSTASAQPLSSCRSAKRAPPAACTQRSMWHARSSCDHAAAGCVARGGGLLSGRGVAATWQCIPAAWDAAWPRRQGLALPSVPPCTFKNSRRHQLRLGAGVSATESEAPPPPAHAQAPPARPAQAWRRRRCC